MLGVDDPAEQQKYAVAAARLCDHTIAWHTSRTRYPAPLHLAMQMDWDHPGYRRTLDEEELEELAEEIDDPTTEQLPPRLRVDRPLRSTSDREPSNRGVPTRGGPD